MVALPTELVYDARKHVKQSAFHNAVRRHDVVLFNGGRGSGKTTAGAIQAILEALEYQPGARGVVVAPSYPMLEDASMAEFFKWLPRSEIGEFFKQRRVLVLRNGSEIAFRSADNPDSLRGPNRAWAWFDEPRNLRTREAFDIVMAQLRPTKKVWLTTTPAGIFHWLYDLFVASPVPNAKVINVRTTDNPYLPPEYHDYLRSQYTGAFAAQELDAQWVSFEGLVYDNFDMAGNVTEDADYRDGLDVLWGVDDGYAYGEGPGHASYHPRVILLAQVTGEGGLNVFAEYARTGIADYNDTLDEVLALPYAEPLLAYVDGAAAMLRGALSERSIINANGSDRPVVEGIKNVRRLICDANGKRLLHIHPRCANLIRELQSYRYDDRSSQATGGEPKPLKVDDHGPDALRYMSRHLWGVA